MKYSDFRACTFACALLLLTACGGGGGGNETPSAPPPTGPGPPAGPTPLPRTTLSSNSGRTSLSYVKLDAWASDVAWDERNHLIYAAMTRDSAMNASSVVAINPTTGRVVTSVSFTAPPTMLRISPDRSYLYVGLEGNAGIRRLRTPTLAEDLSIPFSQSTVQLVDMAASPTNPRTLAVAAVDLVRPQTSSAVAIFDDATMRPDVLQNGNNLPVHDVYIDVAGLLWSADGNSLHAHNDRDAGYVRLAVSPNGVSLDDWRYWTWGNPIQLRDHTLYGSDGAVFDLASNTLAGVFATHFFPTNNHVFQLDSGKAFSVRDHFAGGPFVDGLTLSALDTSEYSIVDEILWPELSANGVRLFAWGEDGLGLIGPNVIYIANGTFAAAGGKSDLPQTPELIRSGTVEGDAGKIDYRVYDVWAGDITSTACDELLLATDGLSSFHPNRLVRFDPASATAVDSVFAGSFPYSLAASDDCTAAYVGLYGSSTVSRVRTPDLAVEASIPLLRPGEVSYGELAFARSLTAIPGRRNSFAVAKGSVNAFLCRGVDLGLAIIDDTVERPNQIANLPYGIKSIAWGGNDSTLYGEDWNHVYSFQVDATGIVGSRSVMPYRIGTSVYDLGRDLHFNAADRRLYDHFFHVYDEVASAEIGPIQSNWGTAIAECGAPTSAMTTDRTTGKIYFAHEKLGQQPFSIVIATYDKTSLSPIAEVQIPPPGIDQSWGRPLRLARWGTDGLALITSGRVLILLDGAMLAGS